MADIHKEIADLSQAQPKTMAMVANVLEKGKLEVMQDLEELEQLRKQSREHLQAFLADKQALETEVWLFVLVLSIC